MNYNEYEDKVALNENAGIPDINKVTDDDMNYIKYNLPHISNEIDSTYKTNVIQTFNLFNKDSVLQNTELDSTNGGTVTNNARITSDYIEVKPSQDYIFSNANDISTNGKALCFYNSNRTFISGGEIPSLTNGKFTTPANTKYIRFGYVNTGDYVNLMLNEGDEAPSSYIPFTYNEIIVNEEKYTDTINVDTIQNSKSKVNILHSKNMLNNTLSTQTKNDITFTKNSDGSITLNGTASANTTVTLGIVSLKSGKTYTLSGGEDLSIDTVRLDMRLSESGNLYDENWYIPNYPTKTMANDITLYASIRVQSGASFTNKVIYPMLEEGSTATIYEPFTYNSILTRGDDFSCGVGVGNNADTRNKVNFVKSRNLFSSSIINGNVSDSAIQSSLNRICTATFIKVKPRTQYTLSFTGNLANINISYFTGNSFPRESESGWTSNFTFITKSNTRYIMISWRKSSNNENVSPADISNVMLNEGSTAQTYQPYGTSINIEGEEIYNGEEWVDITNNIIISSGFTLTSGSLFKKGHHILGDLVINGTFSADTEYTVMTLPNAPVVYINGFCGASNSQYRMNYIAYMYISTSNKEIAVRCTNACSYFKLHIDYITTD